MLVNTDIGVGMDKIQWTCLSVTKKAKLSDTEVIEYIAPSICNLNGG